MVCCGTWTVVVSGTITVVSCGVILGTWTVTGSMVCCGTWTVVVSGTILCTCCATLSMYVSGIIVTCSSMTVSYSVLATCLGTVVISCLIVVRGTWVSMVS